MAGSRRNFEYTSDDGAKYLINMDEDWGELVSNPNPSSAKDFLPRNIRPRIASYTNTSGTSSRNIVICQAGVAVSSLPQTLTITAATGEVSEEANDNSFQLSFFKGQVSSIPKRSDTNMLDGDTDGTP
ncbi:hypothetical protein [Vibrio sp.]|uniref:hypothetical protein n=1 Tax=Vibrio sp. TaxID=678 RepID=UPI003D10FEF2